MKVLIIEDEKAMSDLIAVKFQVEGFEVEQALTVAEAKAKLSGNGPFDAVLSDYLLPDGNSVDFIEEVRNNPAQKSIPFVIMTNYIEDMNVEKAKQLGVVDVLVKYQTVPAQMVEKIKELVVKSSQGGGDSTPPAPTGTPASMPPSGTPPASVPPSGNPPPGVPPAGTPPTGTLPPVGTPPVPSVPV